MCLQFHLGFHPTDENKKHIIECRKFLDVRYPMAVEFRSRVWFSAENLPVSLDLLKQHNIGGYTHLCGRQGGLMVSALESGASSPGSSPGRGDCVEFLGKTLYSHSASLHPGV